MESKKATDQLNRKSATESGDAELSDQAMDRVAGGFNPQPEPPASMSPLDGISNPLAGRLRSPTRRLRR